MDFEISFAPRLWEEALQSLSAGEKLSAARLLTLLEEEDEDGVQEAFEALENSGVGLDVEDLPRYTLAGDLAKRMELEARLVRQGEIPGGLSETDPLRLYLEELARIPAAGDVQVLAMELAKGSETAVTQLTNLMLSRVVEKAFAMAGRGVLLMDLIQDGSLGLWQALLHYSGEAIEAHCDWWIDLYMARALLLQARESGAGQRLRSAMEDYRDVDQRLLAELGRNATSEEIAEQLHISAEEAALVEKMIRTAQTARQMRPEPESETDEPQEDPEDQLAVEDTAYFQSRQRILEMLSTLTETESKLLTLRFGLEGGLPMDPQQAGEKLGLTAREVVTMEAEALAKLRQQNK